ncbi:winged helix-turn-helix domain-containing tetratricopeptide repeat protein [Cupriavidus basilensis]|uniref:Winged helix-turn-helix domain-containing tetratricopeptide repeat protein n=1 Tax=Cupriavidus basilensis TaxID=68895 RepID=A0ABT6ARW2_9BURK|nr:winged helix-turn-helix domain-containing tetratricopeptide repeat protein [Cupriavidus basilensis]MDF3835370.1 winged helix-turn-helix domain-containing tetratricopeptide repeat protein [Cupriavidus basilensis]
MQGQRFTFGPFLLNLDDGTLQRQGERVAVGRRGILLLAALLKRQGEIVTKADLMDAAWPRTPVEESNLSVQIALLRKAVGLAPDGDAWIATVPRIGYCFKSPVATPKEAAGLHSPKPSLAVLPFASLSNDTGQDFFAEGLADEIITTLSKVPGLIVIARSSSFAYKGMSVDVRRIASKLGTRYIIEGSIRTCGGRIRVVAQLSDGISGSQLWTERYDRELNDIFTVQDEVARKIVAKLSVALNPVEVALWPRDVSGGTTHMEAYQCFLRGRAMQRGATQNIAVFERTCELFRQAIALDPDYPSPYAALGMALAQAYYNRWSDDPQRSLAEAEALVEKAIERDPGEPFSHGVAALVAMYRKDFSRWALEVEEALSLNPNFAPALSLRATLNIYSGHPRSAIRDLERAMQLDPYFTQGYLHHLGVAHIVSGDYETAVAILRERILLVPETDMSRAYLASALGNLGYLDEARGVWNELIAINPSYSFADRIACMPFRIPADLARIANGLERAGLLTSSNALPLVHAVPRVTRR